MKFVIKGLDNTEMRTTVTIDDDLYNQAMELSDPGVENPSDLVYEALKTYIRIHAARRLSALGGNDEQAGLSGDPSEPSLW